MSLKSFSETINSETINSKMSNDYGEVGAGKGMPAGERAKNLDGSPETGAVMGDGSEVKEFWDEVERVSLKLGVEMDRVVMALSGKEKGLEYSGSSEDSEIVKEFGSDIEISQSVAGSLLRRGYGGNS